MKNRKDLPVLVDLHKNVFFDEDEKEVIILDRRKLPEKVEHYRCKDYKEVAEAIENMVTQSLGVSPAGAYGVAIAAREVQGKPTEEQEKQIEKAVKRIKNTRPTQTSLHHLLDEMLEIAKEKISKNENLFKAMKQKAYDWTENLMKTSEKLGEYASQKIEDNDTILTHCYGGPAIYFMGEIARENGKKIDYFCTETRPYLQGARLTCFALSNGGFDVTLITDSMAAHTMKKGLIDKFITGADRISMDGSVANKIGTYQIALAADKYEIPFYAISYTGPDPDTPSWRDIEIEMRDEGELKKFRGIKITPERVKGFYPAFDCTPPELVEGIVTDKGIYTPDSVAKYFED